MEHPKPTLARLLRQEIDCADKLLTALQNERAALSNSNPALPDSENSAKAILIDTLQLATQERIGFMKQHGLSASETLRAAQSTGADEDVELNALFVQLADLARQCYEENRLLGQLINRRTLFITQVLDSLSPGARDKLAETYGENGDTSNNPRSALLNLARI